MNYLFSTFGRAATSRFVWIRRQSAGLIIGLVSLVASAALGQTTYYVAANGNDNNDGRSEANAIQTLSKVNGLNLQAGDQVLFRRGDTFRGTLTIRKSGSSSQPIVFDAYGSGAKPIVSGSVPVTGWSNVGGNVWQANCSACGNRLTGLYRGGNDLPLGRYPNYSDANKGYLTIQSHQGDGQLTSKEGLNVNLNTGWSGTEVVVRAVQWVINRYGFNGQSGNTLNMTGGNNGYGTNDNWGFFVQNHPATLDQNGEWAFNTSNKVIQLYSTQGDPNGQNITAAVQSRAFDLAGVSNVTVRNLRLTESLYTTLFVSNASNLTFSNVDVTESGEDGVAITGSGSNVTVENSVIRHANNIGVILDPYSNATFRNNTIRRAGARPGRGRGGDGNYNGFQSTGGQNTLIENNVIDSVGYNGITYSTSITIRRNAISRFCLTKSDGGGVYTWNGNRNNVGGIYVQNNIISNGPGAPEGTPGGAYSGANGIFFDDCTQNAEVSGNTVFNNHGLGIYLRAASSLNINNNTVFNNGEGQIQLAYNSGYCVTRNNNIQNNILVSRLANQFVAKYESNQNDLAQYGTFDYNYYVRPFEDVFKIRTVYNNGSGVVGGDLSLTQWQSQFGKDPNSKNSPITYSAYTLNPVGNPILNNAFNSSTDGWGVAYSNRGNGRVEWEQSGRLDGGSMRIAFPTPSNQSGSYVLASNNIGAVNKGKTYRLKFDAVATSATKRVEIILRQKFGSYSDLAPRSYIQVGTTRKSYELAFPASADESTPIIAFQIDEDGQTIWFDNIQLQEATSTVNNPDDFIKLYTNPTAQNLNVGLDATYRDVKNQAYSGTITLAPFTSLLLLKDNNTSTPTPPPTATLRDPENPANAVSGLDYRYYEGDWMALPDFNSLTPVKSGTTGVPDLTVRSRDELFALRFTGYVNVPTDGQYTFYTTSDDGSKLLIGSTEVVNNDGAHGPQERSGTIGLKAGRHAITVLYFENGGGEELSVKYEGPNLGKQTIPASAFFRINTGTTTPTPPPTTLREPENPANAVVGLDYRYYEGNWTALPDFNSLTPVKTGTIGVPDISVRSRDDFFGLRFTGYVNVPTDGQYTFYTNSDDGSKLFIGSTEVVNNDGARSIQERSGTIGLKAGRHAFTVLYFENAGGEALNVSFEGPGLGKQVIPASAFYRVSSGTTTPTPPPTTTLREPENPANAVVGLDYRYYEGNWSTLPDFNSLTPVKTGTASVPDISVRSRDDFFGLRFTGYVNVPADGQYTFYISSDDGSKLLIGSTEVVNHDGTHPQTEKSGTIGLKAGRHAFTVLYFENAGGEGLSVSYEGPNVSKQVIPASAFYRVGSGSTIGSGTGLRAEYFNGSLTGSPALTRTDATVDFDWGSVSPAPGSVNADNYSVRWSGQVEAPVTGSYVFSTVSDDGVRLWVNGVPVIDNWTTHGPTTDNSPAINLTAGQKYNIRMEYFENAQGAVARLRWSYPGQSQQTIPQSRLYPSAGGRAGAADATAEAVERNDQTDMVVVYPVPAHDQLTIRYQADAAGSVMVQLVDPASRSVLRVEEPVERGENLLKVRVGDYPRGMYVLTLTQGGRRISRKIILSE